MSGLVKAKRYDWKDSSLALFGSDGEKNRKRASAESEPAWKGAGIWVGIQIWRIVKFKVTHWSKADYGKFFDGDTYIILNTYKKPHEDDLEHDVHFWIGKNSTRDEYATAAYKIDELDTLLDEKPVQHREVQGHESSLFKSYFKHMAILAGGAETGFCHGNPTGYKPRLFLVHGDKEKVWIVEVSPSKRSLTSDNVFILDLGLELYMFQGSTCNKDEKFEAIKYMETLRSERFGKPKVEYLDERELSSGHKFYQSLTDAHVENEHAGEADDSEPSILRLSDESGEMSFILISEGQLLRSYLHSNDVFIVDTKKHLFVWVGNAASVDERKRSMEYAHNYLRKTKHPFIPVTCVKEGQINADFDSSLK